MYSENTPDDEQRNCPKHVELYSENKFEKLVRLVGFIIRIYHDARSPEHQILNIYGNMSLELIYLLYFISHVLRIFIYGIICTIILPL